MQKNKVWNSTNCFVKQTHKKCEEKEKKVWNFTKYFGKQICNKKKKKKNRREKERAWSKVVET